MRRVARHAFTILALVSLLLCVATCVLWVRGRGRGHGVWWNTRQFESGLACGNGLLRLYWAGDTLNSRERGCGVWVIEDPRVVRGDWIPRPNRAGFGFSIDRTLSAPGGNWKNGGRLIIVAYQPLWLIVGLTSLLPVVWTWRTIRVRRRLLMGRCVACGYDLRASPERCPECGTVPAAGVR